MTGSLDVRSPTDHDWPAIDRLADVAVAHLEDAPRQQEWALARRRFEGWRQHWVAVRSDEVAGYCALERRRAERADEYRLFLVTDWGGPLDAAELLYAGAMEELARIRATNVWLREYANDQPLIAFFERRGFTVGEPYEVDDTTLVNLTNDVPGSRGTRVDSS
jgi:hypothetical protein